MDNTSRTRNSIKNMAFGVSSQCIVLIINFLSRSIFIYALGMEYLGINGLFSNILSILSLADLGMGTAMMYSMYKPLAEKDEKKLAALTRYFKKIYLIIAFSIAVIGICLVPFLRELVILESPVKYLEIYYLMFLADSVASYLFSYKTLIIYSDQKMYLLKMYSFIFVIIRFITQTIVIFGTHNYILYLGIQVICTFLCNMFSAREANKIYPYINKRYELEKEEKKSIFSNVKSIFLYKIGGVILTSTDNIIISKIIGTIVVGFYSNYSMVVNSIIVFTTIVFNAVHSSIGNLNTNNDKKYQYKVFKTLDFVSFWIFGFCSVCLYVLFNNFIGLWVGQEYILESKVVAIIVLNFYIAGILNPISVFRDTTGLFKSTKYIPIAAATINILFSIILGKLWGLFGIFIATAIARLSTSFILEPRILMKQYFNESVIKYYFKVLVQFIVLIATIAFTKFICVFFDGTSILGFGVQIIISAILPNVIFLIVFFRTEEFKFIYNKILSKFVRLIKVGKHSKSIV